MDEHSKTKQICPYLCGLKDEKTFHTYPTINNRCCLNIHLIEISHEHQELFCLSSRHVECPLYKDPLLAEKARYIDAVPDELRGQTGTADINMYDRSVRVATDSKPQIILMAVLAVLAVAVIAFFAIFQKDNNDQLDAGLDTNVEVPTLAETVPVIPPSDTPLPSPSNTVAIEDTATSAATDTPTATLTNTAPPPPTEVAQIAVEASETPTKTITASPTDTLTATITRTAVHTRTASYTPSATATATHTETTIPTDTATTTKTSTPTATATYTHTVTPTNTLTPTPTSTFTPTNTFTPTFTPTITPTLTLVPPISPTPIEGETFIRTQPQSEQEVYNLINAISDDYGVELAFPVEWQPTTVQEVILFHQYLSLIYEALQTSADYLHYFSRAPQDVTPAQFFRQHFDSARITLDRVTEEFGVYGTRILPIESQGQRQGYLLQLSPNALVSPFPIARELGYVLNEQLNNVPLNDYQQILGDPQVTTGWLPASGYEGFELMFPSATINANEDFEDTFGRMLTGQLSLDVAPLRYSFMLDYLPRWLEVLRSANSS